MSSQEKNLAKAIHYLAASEQKTVLHALEKATEWHEGQYRKNKDPYIKHPIETAQYLTELEAGKDTLCAALLHDVVEDERTTLKEVEEEFGKTVARLVDGVTKLSKRKYEGRRAQRQVESLRKLLLIASEDLRVIIIKLADRRHNLLTIDSLGSEKQKRIAAETLDIYVPFARLVGLWELKRFFEEVSFPIALPKESKEWSSAIAAARSEVEKDREDFVSVINSQTTDDVKAHLRKMTDYEIFVKLQGNLKRLEKVQNIDTVRILTIAKDASAADCYRILGEIHGQYPIRAGAFRDYISAPQANGYSALHTVIFLARGHQLRLRIQTQKMYDYSSRRKMSSWAVERDNDVYKALSSLHSVSYDKENYLTDLKDTVLKKRINVFTVNGEIITLPQGATGVDFAFTLNPDHMSYLAGIRVNEELREATYVLNDGDTVQLILLGNETNGQKNIWIEKVKSVEAREELKKSLQTVAKNERQEQGRQHLDMELKKNKLPTWWLFRLGPLQEKLATKLKKKDFSLLLEDIGTGAIPVGEVVAKFRSMLTKPDNWLVRTMKFFHFLPRARILNKEYKTMDIEVYADDRRGLIHDISQCFSERDINISKFGVYATPQKGALYKIRLEVQNFEDFSDVFDAILQVPNVRKILRKR